MDWLFPYAPLPGAQVWRDVVREAAAAALDAGLPETAVEWLEQGRSIVWGELHQLRSSDEDLTSAHPEHAHRLRELSSALEQAGAAREQSLSAISEGTPNEVHDATRDKLLQEIRSLPGFEQFLRYKKFSRLRASAHSGPVVILNTAENRCDALIVLASVDHAIHVPLPHFTFERSTYLQMILKNFLRHVHVIRSDDREGQRTTLDGVNWQTFLATLWRCIVKPILDALAFSVRHTHDNLSRIFWCPTGPLVFLPIHAAGFYDSQYSHPGHKVFDFVISSYVPTLSILAPSLNSSTAPNGNPRLLAIRQPRSDGLSRLPGVVTELEHIKGVIKDSASASITFLESSVGTVEEVLDLMKESDWVHFACHGIQDAARPTESGLCLANRRRLKVSDMIALSRPHGGLAFLSACQTTSQRVSSRSPSPNFFDNRCKCVLDRWILTG
ncbi:CHAT domain-containing protein [Boletus edulis BED1]|uniref:CHAT domain-containing protein n=1 Tax=Boletus edulis BED1 TaxID=1328754 RepID=A0AAD4GCB5_BOLED|nr:CHAT domain-containing protein [Boletus edulis BED1]